LSKRLITAVSILVCTLLLTACLGPSPVVRETHVFPPAQGQEGIYQVETVVGNHGPGEGQIDVVATLRDKRTGATLAEDDKQVNLAVDGTVHVLFQLQIPPSAKGISPDDVDVQVEANYPE